MLVRSEGEKGEGERERENGLLLRPNGVYTISEFLGLREVREFGLHPYHIAVRCVRNGAVNGALAAALVPVVSFSRPGSLPVEVYVHAG